MPEGDTIFRTAKTLTRALVGHQITMFRSDFPQLNRVDEDKPFRGRIIESVDPHGKHLLIRFSGNLTIRTHLRMKGSWHIYRAGEAWKRPERNARIVIGTENFVAVGFSIPVAEIFDSDRESANRELRRLGPDLLDDAFDLPAAVRRLQSRTISSVADALLNQTVMAGVGNVYKSEILFLCGIHPNRSVSSLTDGEATMLVEQSRELLRRNVDPEHQRPGQRRTTRRLSPRERLWVYGRGGAPCRTCGSKIARALIGKDARVTYWCPSCQPARSD